MGSKKKESDGKKTEEDRNAENKGRLSLKAGMDEQLELPWPSFIPAESVLCVCVCVCVCERERERVCVCVCVCV